MRASSAAPGTILLYEPPTNHKDPKSGKGAMIVGYADGSVMMVTQPQADKIIAEVTGVPRMTVQDFVTSHRAAFNTLDEAA